MKTISKILLTVIALLIISSSSVFAKKHSSAEGRFSAGLELALPSGDFGDNAGTGFGAGLRYELPEGDNIGLIGTVSYLTFGSKTTSDGYGDSYKYTSSLIPIMVGGKYYFTEQQNGFYGMVQLGATMFTNKADITVAGVGTTSNSNTTTAFTWSPGVGYVLNNFDFSVAYYAFSYSETVTTQTPFGPYTTTASYSGNWIGVRAAYMFGGN